MKQFNIVLLIDDDSISSYICSKVIQKADICEELLVFEDGLAALSYLKDTKGSNKFPDLILLDLYLGIMTGWDFIEQYKDLLAGCAKQKPSYLLLMSASNDEGMESRVDHTPEITDFIEKPLLLDGLKQLLQGAAFKEPAVSVGGFSSLQQRGKF